MLSNQLDSQGLREITLIDVYFAYHITILPVFSGGSAPGSTSAQPQHELLSLSVDQALFISCFVHGRGNYTRLSTRLQF